MSQPRKLLPVANPKCGPWIGQNFRITPRKAGRNGSKMILKQAYAPSICRSIRHSSWLQNSGADYVQMTGTGSAAFGVFARESEATAAATRRHGAGLGFAFVRDECLPLRLRRPYFGAFQQITAPSIAKSRLGNHAASNSQFSREINASGDSETDAA